MAKPTSRLTPPESFAPSLAAHSPMSRAAKSGPAAQAPDELDCLVRGEAVDRERGLGLDRARFPGERGVGDDVAAGEGDRPGVRQQQPDDLVDERRLAGAVVAEQPVHLARVDGEIDAVVGECSSPVRLREAGDLEEHRVGSPCSRQRVDTAQYAHTQ
jgi:hypothetical protein